MPQISVIVPVYKVELFLRRCVDSVLAQSFQNFELILVDDGSPDRSGVICDKYASMDGRIRVIHQKNGGLSAARNAGMEWVFANSNSEWITFVDSDDWVHPEYLKCLYEGALRLGAQIASCDYLKTACEITYGTINSLPMMILPEADYCREGKITAYAWGRLYSRSLWDGIRFPLNRLWEDVSTIYKVLFLADRVCFVNEKLYYYYQNPYGIVNRLWEPSRMDEFKAYEEQLLYFADKPEYKRVYTSLQHSYIKALEYSYFKEQRSNLLPDKKKYYARIIRHKMRIALRKYGYTSGINFKEDKGVFDTAFPALMQFYWVIRGRLEKLRHRK